MSNLFDGAIAVLHGLVMVGGLLVLLGIVLAIRAAMTEPDWSKED